jgi:uncharacterized protein (DUF849 family)
MRGTTPVVIAVAPNGARKTRNDHPRLPMLPSELAQCAEECMRAGAAMLHLHVRDAEGRHSLDPEHYRAAIVAIRARVGDELILQVTSEAAGKYAPAEQMAAIEALAPEAVSVAIRELFAHPEGQARAGAFLAGLAARASFVQYIVYDRDDLVRCAALQASGLIPQRRPHVLFVLGSYAERRAGKPAELLPMLAALPTGWPWSVCAFGVDELRCVIAAALLGGQVRVGFENNMQLPTGETAADNAALVRRTASALASLALRPATCHEARHLFRTLGE